MIKFVLIALVLLAGYIVGTAYINPVLPYGPFCGQWSDGCNTCYRALGARRSITNPLGFSGSCTQIVCYPPQPKNERCTRTGF